MPRYARHLAEHTIVNLFPGIVEAGAPVGPRRAGAHWLQRRPAELRSPLRPLLARRWPSWRGSTPTPYALVLRERAGGAEPPPAGRNHRRCRRRQPDSAGAAPA